MADEWTALIAAITGIAGLGGSVIAGRFSLKVTAKSHRKDDLASLRDKFEELSNEIDRIQNLSNFVMSRAMTAKHQKKFPEERFEDIDLGKVRAIIQLYFPTCLVAVNARDQQDADDLANLRVDLVNNPLHATCDYLILRMAGVSRMCSELRQILAPQALEIGESVRQSLGDQFEERREFCWQRGVRRFAIALSVPYFGYWALTGWLADAAIPDYLKRIEDAQKRNDVVSLKIWTRAFEEANTSVQRAVEWGITTPLSALLVAGIAYWVYRGFRSKLEPQA